MVRLKHRYLLLDILYPDPSTWPASIKQKQNRKSNPPDTTGYDEPPAQLAIHTPTPDSLTPGLLAKMVREEVAEMFGDWAVGKLGGAAGGGINVKYLSPATSTAIIRCPRASFRLVWSALTYMSQVPDANISGSSSYGGREKRSVGAGAGGTGRPCVFRVIRVSGTMRKAEEEAIRRARREIVQVRGMEEECVLRDLVGSVDVSKDAVTGDGSRGVVPVVESVMDESEDEDGDGDMTIDRD